MASDSMASDGTAFRLDAAEVSAMDLREYEAAKFEMAEIVRAIVGSAPRGATDISDAARDLLGRLAEDRFNLVVAGRFSRGKTTLMNAILGTDRLPTGVLPLTSVITSVAYGSRERVQIELEGAAIGFDIAMEALSDYITERGNPGNVRRIRAARIELPAEILRRGFYFIDTPGLGSAMTENSRTTEAFLPQADAAILVSGYDGPLAGEELRVARAIGAADRPLFVVLNKCDLVDPPSRLEVERYVRTRLEETLPESPLRLFPLSALAGFTARMAGDRAGYAGSGVANLEEALTRFLLEEKSRIVLSSVARRARELMERAESASRQPELPRRLAELSERLAPGRTPTSSGGPARTRMEDCAICLSVRETVLDFLRRYQLDLVTQGGERDRLASAGGLCGRHLWLYASIAAERDICVALAPLVERMGKVLEQTPLTIADARLHSTIAVCKLCERQREGEAQAIAALTGKLEALRMEAPRELPSICLPHLRAIALHTTNGRLLKMLVERQTGAAQRLAEDMRRYALKHDGLRRGLTTEEEARAARSAIVFLAADRSLATDHG